MSNYIINFTAPSTAPYYKQPFTILEGKLNTTSTSLSLCGHNYPNYGTTLWTNVVHMLENFCSNAYPDHSTRGQLWYDSLNDKLMVYNGEDYVYISGNSDLELTWGNLNGLLKSQSPPYFDSRYITKSGDTGIGSLEFASNSNLTLTGDGTVKTQLEAKDDYDVVNRAYIAKLFSYLGYDIDNFGTSTSATMYLELIGGTMKADANIKFAGSGTVKVNDDPVESIDVVNKGYAENHYVSFAPGANTKSVANLVMSGPLTLYPDSCDLADDSLEAVPAQWVTDKIRAALSSNNQGSGTYIPISTTTGTEVSNNLTFIGNHWLKVDLDAATWAADNTLVLNKKQADTLYVKKAGDSLLAHPFTFTQPATQPTVDEEKLDALNVPTAGWVNHRIADAVSASGSGGPTATKLSVYGTKITIPATQKTEPTTPNQTISLTIPANSTAIDYEIRLGCYTTGPNVPATSVSTARARIIVRANGVKVFEAYDSITASLKDPGDSVHDFKFSAPANAAQTLTVEMYAYVWTLQGMATYGFDIQQWVIADPLSATVAIQATNAPPAGTVTAGPAGNVTYVDFGNGMVMISGTTQTEISYTSSASNAGVMCGTNITFPNNIKLKIPYITSATMIREPTQGNLSWNEVDSDSGHRVTNVTQTGCSVNWLVGISKAMFTGANKTYYTTPRDVHWTVTGFKV